MLARLAAALSDLALEVMLQGGRGWHTARMSDGAKIAVFRVLWVATGCLWAIQLVRVIRGGSLDEGPIALIWLLVWGVFLIATPWSAAARRTAKQRRRETASTR